MQETLGDFSHDFTAPAQAAHSRYWQRTQRRLAEFAPILPEGLPDLASMREGLNALLARGLALPQSLRVLRALVVARLVELECVRQASLDAVMACVTALAELALDAALAAARSELDTRHGPALDAAGQPIDFWIVGMGKLGARELNVSSDVDLIYVWNNAQAQAGHTSGPAPISHTQFFDQLARRIGAIIGEVSADGFVFRVDLALRPHGKSGPLAVTLEALQTYFENTAREWERFAWLKSRVVAPMDGLQRAQALRPVVLPFVFRRYLDYGVFEALRQLHGQIRAHAASSTRAVRGGPDVKLGAGGIREIEFAVQLLQVVRGGQYPELRCRPTLEAITRLARAALIEPVQAQQLTRAYRFLRNVEHRIQYLDDQQTHTLPAAAADIVWIAQTMGFADAQTFQATLTQHRARVEAIFEAIVHGWERFQSDNAQAHSQAPQDAAASAASTRPSPNLGPNGPLSSSGFGALEHKSTPINSATSAASAPSIIGHTAPSASIQTIEGPAGQCPYWPELAALTVQFPTALAARMRQWSMQPNICELPAPTQVRLLRLVAATAQALQSGQATQLAASRFFDWIEPLLVRSHHLALLAERPRIHSRLLHILGAAQWTAQFLRQHPGVVDELGHARLAATRFDPARFEQELIERARALGRTGEDNEEVLQNVLRRAHHGQVLRTLTRDLEGAITVEQVADELSQQADTILRVATNWCWQRLERTAWQAAQSGVPTQPPFAVIAYGKLGGLELGYGSDLDVVFVFDDASDGAQARYSALARKLIAWLTNKTSEGDLFEIDTALRPNGASGLLVTSFAAYADYQRQRGANTAWTWEHQAMTRARFVTGPAALKAAFDQVRLDVITAQRNTAALRGEILAMRHKMALAHPKAQTLEAAHFDLKHSPGGMVDAEFAVQFLVLAHAHAHCTLAANAGNIALLERAEALGLLPMGVGRNAAAAYRHWRRAQHAARLNPGHANQSHAALVDARDAILALWQAVFGSDRLSLGT